MVLPIETRHILIWLLVFGFLSRDLSTQQIETVCWKRDWRARPLFAFLVFLPIFLMAVFGRSHSDLLIYLRIFRSFPLDLSAGIQNIIKATEPGFSALIFLIKRLFGTNPTTFRLFVALIHTLPVVLVLRKYSVDYVYSVFLFIAFNHHQAWMMNGLRQFIAVTLIFASTPWIIRGDMLKPILVVLFASLFHRTALFFIPVIIIVRGEIWNRKTILFIFLTVAAMFFFDQNKGLFDELARSFGYSLSYVKGTGDEGANPVRMLVHAVPMALAFTYREQLKRDNDPVINLCVNMSVIQQGFI